MITFVNAVCCTADAQTFNEDSIVILTQQQPVKLGLNIPNCQDLVMLQLKLRFAKPLQCLSSRAYWDVG